MKSVAEIEIDLPRETVLAKFEDSATLKHWLRGLVSVALLEGVPGHPGARLKVIGFLMPGSFRKQSKQHLEDFKAFAERGQSVAG
jgi:hypothetical protein